jgi:hypothetical protein
MIRTLLVISLIALVLTKVADIVTTVRGIRRHGIQGEQNPLARWVMSRWGVCSGIFIITILWFMIIVLTYLPAWIAPPWYQWSAAFLGFLVAWIQWDVARFNTTGRQSWITRRIHRSFLKWQRRRIRH